MGVIYILEALVIVCKSKVQELDEIAAEVNRQPTELFAVDPGNVADAVGRESLHHETQDKFY